MAVGLWKGKRLFGAVASRGAAAPAPELVHLLTKREGSVHAICGALSPCMVTSVEARVTCAACRQMGTAVPEPTCPNVPTVAAHLNARMDRAEEVVRLMTQLGDEVHALMHGMEEDTRTLAIATVKGEIQPSELLPFVERWARIQALANEAQQRWVQAK